MGGVVSAVAFALMTIITAPRNPPQAISHPPATIQQTPATLINLARQQIGIDVMHHYNFAITGQSGSGKSSLINAIRGFSDTDPRAAKVGEVETTMKIQSYVHPSYPHVVLWDLPGINIVSISSSS